MTCASSEPLFAEYADGTLTPARRTALLAHVSTCGSCTGLMHELHALDGLLAAPLTVELPDDFAHATMSEVQAIPQPRRAHRPALAYLVCYLTAAWLLIAAGMLIAGPEVRASAVALVEAVRAMIVPFFALLIAAVQLTGVPAGASVAAALLLVLTGAAMVAAFHPRLLARLRS